MIQLQKTFTEYNLVNNFKKEKRVLCNHSSSQVAISSDSLKKWLTSKMQCNMECLEQIGRSESIKALIGLKALMFKSYLTNTIIHLKFNFSLIDE